MQTVNEKIQDIIKQKSYAEDGDVKYCTKAANEIELLFLQDKLETLDSLEYVDIKLRYYFEGTKAEIIRRINELTLGEDSARVDAAKVKPLPDPKRKKAAADLIELFKPLVTCRKETRTDTSLSVSIGESVRLENAKECAKIHLNLVDRILGGVWADVAATCAKSCQDTRNHQQYYTLIKDEVEAYETN